MLNRLVQKKKIILIVCAVVLIVLWILTLIFGNGEDKVTVLVLSLLLPFIFYGFVRVMYKIVKINAPSKVMRFFFWFFLIGATLGFIMMIVKYVTDFPNGLSPSLGGAEGLIVATLDEAKKNIETETQK